NPWLESKLLRVQLDDELFVNRRRLYVFALRQRHYFALELLAVDFEPRYSALALRDIARFHDHRVLVHVFLDGDFLAHVHLVGRNVDLLPVDADVAVQHELPRLRTRGRKSRSPHDVVEPTLEENNQVFTGRTLRPLSLMEVIPELAFEQAIGALHLLLFAQL